MARKTKFGMPILKVRKGATLREIYKRAREEFTAADLQKYTEIDDPKVMVPAEEFLAKIEEIHRKGSAVWEKKQKAKKNAKKTAKKNGKK
jgi:hypothetical protein